MGQEGDSTRSRLDGGGAAEGLMRNSEWSKSGVRRRVRVTEGSKQGRVRGHGAQPRCALPPALRRPAPPPHGTQHPGLILTYLSHQVDHKLLEGKADVILHVISTVSSMPGLSPGSPNY